MCWLLNETDVVLYRNLVYRFTDWGISKEMKKYFHPVRFDFFANREKHILPLG